MQLIGISAPLVVVRSRRPRRKLRSAVYRLHMNKWSATTRLGWNIQHVHTRIPAVYTCEAFGACWRSREWRARSSSCRPADGSKRSTAISDRRERDATGVVLSLRWLWPAGRSLRRVARRTGTRTSSGELKETVRQIRSLPRRVKLWPRPYGCDNACKRARSRSFRVEARRPLACCPRRDALRCERWRGDAVIKMFRYGVFVVSSIRGHSWHESLPLKGRSQICLWDRSGRGEERGVPPLLSRLFARSRRDFSNLTALWCERIRDVSRMLAFAIIISVSSDRRSCL